MVLPHYYARFIGGEIMLNDEYSEYRWVNLRELDQFEPKIETVAPMVEAVQKNYASCHRGGLSRDVTRIGYSPRPPMPA